MSIHDYLARFVDGGARPNLYMTRFAFPAGIEVGDATEKSYLCKSTSLPASTIGTAEAPFMGRSIMVAGDREFAPWTVTMMTDNNFAGRKSFIKWMDLINDPTPNTGDSKPANYFANMAIDVLDRVGEPIFTVEIHGTFPTEVGEISLGYAENNSFIEFDVTFAVNDILYDV